MSDWKTKVELLHTDIGEALRSAGFQAAACRIPSDLLRQAAAEELAAMKIEVTVIDVGAAPEGTPGGYVITWQPPSGGPFQKQRFRLDREPSSTT